MSYTGAGEGLRPFEPPADPGPVAPPTDGRRTRGNRPRAVGGTRRVAPGTLQRLSRRSSPWSPCHHRSPCYHSRRKRCRRAATSRALLATDYTHDRRHSDEGGARGAGDRCGRPHEEARRSHRRDRVRQHRRGAPPRVEGRTARLRRLPPPASRATQSPQPEDRRPGGRGIEARGLLHDRQGADQPGPGLARPPALDRVAGLGPSPSACSPAARSARVCWCSA